MCPVVGNGLYGLSLLSTDVIRLVFKDFGGQEKSSDSGVGDTRQEESVQTCLKAIASLTITTEDPH